MDKQEQIRERLRQIAKGVTSTTLLAKVLDVDEENYKCSLIVDDVVYHEVRLRPVIDGKQSLTIFPMAGTFVLAIKIDEEDDWMIIAVGEASKFRIAVDDLVFEMGEKLQVTKDESSLFDILKLIIEAMQAIIVIEGRNPDQLKLGNALSQLNAMMH